MSNKMGINTVCCLYFVTFAIYCVQITNTEYYHDYVMPELVLQALTPKGFRVFLPGDSRITLFLFDGEIHHGKPDPDSLNSTFYKEIWGYGQNKTQYGWTFEEPDVKLDVGNFIRYKAFVSTGHGSIDERDNDGKATFRVNGYATESIVFEVKVLESPSAHGPHCPQTATKVFGGYACAGQILFEDDFETFRDDLWQIEHYIPIDHPDHPFVTYQRLLSDPTVFVKDGKLHIVPKLQEDLMKAKNQSILSGTLDLTSGCTDRVCSVQAVGVDIIPPIVSGRVTSGRFAFTYGKVQIRAKLPKGDWLYPEIHLEPLSKKYGSMNYASGLLKIAIARGNTDVQENFSNKKLYGGPIINSKCRSALEFYYKKIDSGFWGDEFHDYELVWTPEELVLNVDGINWGRFAPGASGLRAWLPSSCRGPWYELLSAGGIMAPFDDHFHIILGVAAGGIMEFPDGLMTGSGEMKPWRNRGRKAALSFWQNHSSWYPTWKSPGLIIDSVKVTAL